MTLLNKVKKVIVHHSAGSKSQTIEDIRAEHLARGWSDVGYHKVITPDGKVHQGRPDAVVGAQAFGANQFSLGICCIGNYDVEKPSQVVLDSLTQVVTVLCERHNLGVDDVIGHRDVASLYNVPDGATACPGQYLYHDLNTTVKPKVKVYLDKKSKK